MSRKRTFHFTGIDSPVMFDLAVAMKLAGHEVSGSSNPGLEATVQDKLTQHGLLPDGSWHPERLSPDVDALILAPSIPKDNSEVQKAQELKIPVFSYPEFIQLQCLNKHRVVVTGSPGKTMIVLFILHVLRYHNRPVDYVMSHPIQELGDSVKITDAPVVIIDAQDGLASSVDPTAIFLKYNHHIGIISGVEWFSSHTSKEEFAKQISLFEKATPKGGVLIYFDLEPVVAVLGKEHLSDVLYIPYKTHPSLQDGGKEYLMESSTEKHPVKLSGKHNMQCLSAAKETLKKLGITTPMFYEAIEKYNGEAV